MYEITTLNLLAPILAFLPLTLIALAFLVVARHNGTRVEQASRAFAAVSARANELQALMQRTFSAQKQDIADLRSQINVAIRVADAAEVIRMGRERDKRVAMEQESRAPQEQESMRES
jgi:hypothetical protein